MFLIVVTSSVGYHCKLTFQFSMSQPLDTPSKLFRSLWKDLESLLCLPGAEERIRTMVREKTWDRNAWQYCILLQTKYKLCGVILLRPATFICFVYRKRMHAVVCLCMV
jgi:hypothetical protein